MWNNKLKLINGEFNNGGKPLYLPIPSLFNMCWFLIVITILVVLTILKRKVKKLSWLNTKRLNGIGLFIGLIIGLSVSVPPLA